MSFQDYLDQIQDALNTALVVDNARLIEFQAEIRSESAGFLAGVLQYEDGSELHFREYADTSRLQPRLMYVYHYQDVDKRLIFRYDNAAHRPALSKPDHKHTTTEGVYVVMPPTLQEVLDEIH